MRSSPKAGKLLQFDTSSTSKHESPRTPMSPTVEQLLAGDGSRWTSPIGSPMYRKELDFEEDHSQPQKKSVLMKVKEKAKKLRHSLSKKKYNEDSNVTPSWGVSLEDLEEEEEDAEYLGAPMYESELAPEVYKEHVRQHPRADPVIAESHSLSTITDVNNENPEILAKQETNSPKQEETDQSKPQESDKSKQKETDSPKQQETENSGSPHKTLTRTVTEKLAPAYATVSDATHAFASKLQSLTISTSSANKETDTNTSTVKTDTNQNSPSPSEKKFDKGVSVKEYILNKLEPGEDEKALSQAITSAMSPRRSPTGGKGGVTVVDKVRGVVSSLLWSDKTRVTDSSTSPHSSVATDSSAAANSPHAAVCTDASDVVQEEGHGRILQTN